MEGTLGEIRFFVVGPLGLAPNGWKFCQGQTLLISRYGALYSILGPTYGGDRETDFKLPNISAPVPGVQAIICVIGIYPNRTF